MTRTKPLEKRKKKLGIALGGGGAKGLAHIGVLSVFREAGIEFDVVAGTSVGALVGALYAAGKLDALRAEAEKIELANIPFLLSPSWSLSGMFSGKNVIELLSELLDVSEIEQLPKPYAALATDLFAGERRTITSGPLLAAIRASIAIPGVFTPMQFDGSTLVDGGILEPIPVRACRDLGAEYVVAIDLFGEHSVRPLGRISAALAHLRRLTGQEEALPTLLEIIEETLSLSQRELTKHRLLDCPADLLIQPSVGEIGLLDFHCADTGIQRGAQCACEFLTRLLSVRDDESPS